MREGDVVIPRYLQRAAAVCGALLLGAVPALAKEARVALVPGGPHPYFAAWAQGGKDAMKAFRESPPPTTRFRPVGNSGCRTS